MKYIIQEVLGSKMCLLPNDPGISKRLKKNPIHEPSATEIIQKEIKPGWVCLDIGANIGYYALLIARLVGEHGRVFAIEPVPDNLAAITESIKINKYKNIEPHLLALGREEAEVKFHLSKNSALGTLMDIGEVNDSYKQWWTDRSKGKDIIVRVTSFDWFVKENNIDRINFIRMDVESFEYEIIPSMLEVIKNLPKPLALFIEFHYHLKDSPSLAKKAIEDIIDCGFYPKYTLGRRDGLLLEGVKARELSSFIYDYATKCKGNPIAHHIFFEKK